MSSQVTCPVEQSSLPDSTMRSKATGQGRERPISRLKAAYKGFALLILNTIVFYVVLNAVLGMLFWIRDVYKFGQPSRPDPITAQYGPEVLDKVYPGMDRSERNLLLLESWRRPFVYSDFTHFQEHPFVGKYVNVSEAGYRRTVDQGPWPPARENINVFVFGGSTTFGYGQPDDQTLASHLQQALGSRSTRRVCVYNFGVGWYYSSQERLSFEKLVLAGHVPNIAIFIDGMNDQARSDNRPAFSQEMSLAFNRLSAFRESQSPALGVASNFQQVREACFDRLPIGRLASYLQQQLVHGETNVAKTEADVDEALRHSCRTYFVNKSLIEQCCSQFEVTPIFVWQPAPWYNYDLKNHLFIREAAGPHRPGLYEMVRDFSERGPATPNFLWCADIQQGRTECLYCDEFHYTGTFMKVFANYICQLCAERKLLDRYLDVAADGSKSPAS